MMSGGMLGTSGESSPPRVTGHDPDCTLCQTAEREGWWGEYDVTHCRDCGATWPMATKTAHCCRCHRTFSSHGVSDRHQVDGECRNPATMVNQKTGEKIYGFPPRPNKYGTPIWRGPASELPFKKEASNDEVESTPQGGGG